MTEEVTVVLTAYNKPQYLDMQIEAIKNQTVKPKEIMLWYNKGDSDQKKIEDEDIKVAYCTHNLKYHSRFAYALLAKTKYVMLFDDDTIPGKRWLESCIKT